MRLFSLPGRGLQVWVNAASRKRTWRAGLQPLPERFSSRPSTHRVAMARNGPEGNALPLRREPGGGPSWPQWRQPPHNAAHSSASSSLSFWL